MLGCLGVGGGWLECVPQRAVVIFFIRYVYIKNKLRRLVEARPCVGGVQGEDRYQLGRRGTGTNPLPRSSISWDAGVQELILYQGPPAGISWDAGVQELILYQGPLSAGTQGYRNWSSTKVLYQLGRRGTGTNPLPRSSICWDAGVQELILYQGPLSAGTQGYRNWSSTKVLYQLGRRGTGTDPLPRSSISWDAGVQELILYQGLGPLSAGTQGYRNWSSTKVLYQLGRRGTGTDPLPRSSISWDAGVQELILYQGPLSAGTQDPLVLYQLGTGTDPLPRSSISWDAGVQELILYQGPLSAGTQGYRNKALWSSISCPDRPSGPLSAGTEGYRNWSSTKVLYQLGRRGTGTDPLPRSSISWDAGVLYQLSGHWSGPLSARSMVLYQLGRRGTGTLSSTKVWSSISWDTGVSTVRTQGPLVLYQLSGHKAPWSSISWDAGVQELVLYQLSGHKALWSSISCPDTRPSGPLSAVRTQGPLVLYQLGCRGTGTGPLSAVRTQGPLVLYQLSGHKTLWSSISCPDTRPPGPLSAGIQGYKAPWSSISCPDTRPSGPLYQLSGHKTLWSSISWDSRPHRDRSVQFVN